MKKFILLALVLAQMLLPSALAVKPTAIPTTSTPEQTTDMKDFTVDGFTMSVPASWFYDSVDENGITFHRFTKIPLFSQWSGFLRIYTYGTGVAIDVDFLGESAYDSYFLNLGTNTRKEQIEIAGKMGFLFSTNVDYGNNTVYPTYGVVLIYKDLLLSALYVDVTSDSDTNMAFVREIADSIRIDGLEPSQQAGDLSLIQLPLNYDFGSLSFDELLSLRQQLDKALLASDGWKDALIPQGDYIVGKDIPAGEWSISLGSDDTSAFGEIKLYPDEQSYLNQPLLNVTKDEVLQPGNTLTVRLKEGNYIVIQMCPMRIMPYTGAVSLWH